MLWSGINSFFFRNEFKKLQIGRAYCSLNNSRIRTTALCRLYLRAYDIAHHAQFVQTVTGSRRALWIYFTKLQLISYNILPFFL